MILVLGWLATPSHAQDTTQVLPWGVYLQQVYHYHPVARQLRLQPELAQAQLMTARGYFDPKVKSTFRGKDFKETDYFQLWDSKVEVPVWNFADLKAGYERNQGVYLNPEATVPENGLWYAGVSVPIGRGLFIDSRRAAVQQALLDLEGTEVDRQKNMNKFLLMAAKAYWEWTQAHQQFVLQQEGVTLAEFRLEGVRQRVTQGDAAAVDTLEANLQYQSRMLDYNQALLDVETARLLVETYLWSSQEEPLQLQPGISPEQVAPLSSMAQPRQLDSLIQLVATHPELRKYEIKGEQLGIDRRLAIENLKPELNLEYNWLWAPGAEFDQVIASTFVNDYKWGASFAIPILLRKERGKLNQVRIKQEQNSLEIQQTYLVLENELRQRYRQYLQYQQMFQQADLMASQYAQLLAAERTKFQNGESSLFLVNSREVKYLEARRKRIELEAKLGKALAEVWERAGVLEVIWLDALPEAQE